MNQNNYNNFNLIIYYKEVEYSHNNNCNYKDNIFYTNIKYKEIMLPITMLLFDIIYYMLINKDIIIILDNKSIYKYFFEYFIDIIEYYLIDVIKIFNLYECCPKAKQNYCKGYINRTIINLSITYNIE